MASILDSCRPQNEFGFSRDETRFVGWVQIPVGSISLRKEIDWRVYGLTALGVCLILPSRDSLIHTIMRIYVSCAEKETAPQEKMHVAVIVRPVTSIDRVMNQGVVWRLLASSRQYKVRSCQRTWLRRGQCTTQLRPRQSGLRRLRALPSTFSADSDRRRPCPQDQLQQ